MVYIFSNSVEGFTEKKKKSNSAECSHPWLDTITLQIAIEKVKTCHVDYRQGLVKIKP